MAKRKAKVEFGSIKLPAGKTCGDCVHYRRCSWMFHCDELSTVCDWVPNRFEERPAGQPIDWWAPMDRDAG